MKKGILLLVVGFLGLMSSSVFSIERAKSDYRCKEFCRLKSQCPSLAPKCPLQPICNCGQA
ncbi:MAG TPA: hypothetical protein DCZ80_08000 [Legionellales bacterium]|nr:hypothetical protein [Legionellales bacterium]